MIKKIEPYKDIALIYEQVRPSYPAQLIQDIIAATNIGLNSRLLEIGAGTGKATVQLAEKGFKIHAIEVGKDMGEILVDKCVIYPNVSVEISSFEEWTPKHNDKYDMIFCAQAFHWLDATIKYKKCHDLLKENGYLILFWYNASADMTKETEKINQKVNEIVRKYVDRHPETRNKPERNTHSGVFENDERKSEIETSGLFEILDILNYKDETKNNAEQFIKAQKSVPAFASLLDELDDKTIQDIEEEIKSEINNNGGYVGTLFNYSLYITKRIANNIN
ncbi:class I SAM-dependent methyltransferase [Mobilitalea sibirica]|uniref:Class I SAM-dependent methyltransferase n=1 Tax=Mobilitalea sibirica TaxID=1462919 RepID=A0A8J7HB98_9FIRM|nr:class I SAM-dependent methyltransferase [Mobilitalea sibirica]MBH1939742.1 class I SAM-dependent methyltransferase [Mobilitalea sibirica]